MLATDLNHSMLRILADNAAPSKRTLLPVIALAERLALRPRSVDFATCFNAIHHLDVPGFLSSTAKAVRTGGHIFIYTRTPEQNAGSVWGRQFPGFVERESRLHTEADLVRAIGRESDLELVHSQTFRFRRESTVRDLKQEVYGGRYSTFSLYDTAELDEAVAVFTGRLGSDRVSWTDENLLLIARCR